MSQIDFSWGNLLIGIQFVLGLQLLLTASTHLLLKSHRKRIPLSFLGLILAFWFFRRVFDSVWQENDILLLFIGPGKEIFVGPLLFFYTSMFTRKLSKVYVLRHLAIPGIYYVSLFVSKWFFVDYFPSIGENLNLFFSVLSLSLLWYYFFVTKREFELHLRKKLKTTAYKKAVFLFYSLNFFLLQIPIWNIISYFSNFYPQKNGFFKSLHYLNEHLFSYIGANFAYAYLHVLGLLTFLYILSEIIYFKKWFLPQEVLIDDKTLENRRSLEQLVVVYFQKKKIYTQPDLNIETFAEIIGYSKKEVLEYFQVFEKMSFKDFVNAYRVEEFKSMLFKPEYEHFNLLGLGKECGFNSRATFFRVFKNIEGMTPNEYKKTTKKS